MRVPSTPPLVRTIGLTPGSSLVARQEEFAATRLRSAGTAHSDAGSSEAVPREPTTLTRHVYAAFAFDRTPPRQRTRRSVLASILRRRSPFPQASALMHSARAPNYFGNHRASGQSPRPLSPPGRDDLARAARREQVRKWLRAFSLPHWSRALRANCRLSSTREGRRPSPFLQGKSHEIVRIAPRVPARICSLATTGRPAARPRGHLSRPRTG
jgi:hypothetical protein